MSMECHYCENLDKYGILPATETVGNEGQTVLVHRDKYPLAFQVRNGVFCKRDEPEQHPTQESNADNAF